MTKRERSLLIAMADALVALLNDRGLHRADVRQELALRRGVIELDEDEERPPLSERA